MSNFQVEARMNSQLSPTEIVSALMKGAKLVGVEVRQSSDFEFELSRGDEEALRFRGGLLSPIHYFPVVALVNVFPSSRGSEVQIRISDSWSGGILFGMKKKYVQALDEFRALILDMCA